MKEIIIKRIIVLALIGILCLVTGMAYGIATGDKTLIIMSLIICIVNGYKVWDIKQTEKKGKYIIVSGKCVDSTASIAGRYRTYKISDADKDFEVSVPKSVKLEINKTYNLYFKKTDIDMFAQEKWLKNKLLSENFLGCEEK